MMCLQDICCVAVLSSSTQSCNTVARLITSYSVVSVFELNNDRYVILLILLSTCILMLRMFIKTSIKIMHNVDGPEANENIIALCFY